ncbi:MAG: tRNA (adenosine(37)-N6)-threonylcarbamoyltransferase complex dimerization subunit type 1 TsaB [Desulfovibrionaceae bacterium]
MTSPETSPTPHSDPVLLLGGCEGRLLLGLCRLQPGQPARLLAGQQWEAPGRMADILGPALDQMLRLLKLNPRDLGGVACLRGPGSFTGLRIVLAFAEGLRLPGSLPAAGLSHLEALARSAQDLLGPRTVVVTHARTRQVHAQEFQGLAPVCDPAVLDLDLARELVLAVDPGRTTVLGSGLRRNPSLAQELAAAGVRLLDERRDEPDLQAVADLAAEAPFTAEPLTPLYLRPADAEENLDRIAHLRGLSREEADRILASARLDPD